MSSETHFRCFVALAVWASVVCAPAFAQPYLVKDINANPGGTYNSAPAWPFVAFNGRMLFFTRFGLHSSDGTVAGTSLIVPGVSFVAAGAAGASQMYTAAVNNRVVFSGVDRNMFATDGTAANTVQLTTSTGGPIKMRGTAFFVSGSTAYFLGAPTTTDPIGVWQTDGTSAGTFGGLATLPAGVAPLSAAFGNGKLYVTAYLSTDNSETLYSGTTSGPATTVRVLSTGGGYTRNLMAVPSGLYVEDGTASLRWVWFMPFATGAFNMSIPTRICTTYSNAQEAFHGALGNAIVVSRFDAEADYLSRLWLGTPTSNAQLDTNDSVLPSPNVPQGVAIGNTLIVNAYHGGNGIIRRTDGTAAGTTNFDAWPSTNVIPHQLIKVGNEVWFNNSNAFISGIPHKWMAWDATSAAPRDVYTYPSTNLSGTYTPGVLGNRVFHNGTLIPGSGTELCTTDGTAAGTYQLQDLGHSTNDTAITWFTRWNDKAFFSASGSLWVTDGTNAGTRAVKLGTSSIYVTRMVATPNCLLIDNNGGPLLRSDGTAEGTYVIGPTVRSGFTGGTFPERHPGFAPTRSGITYFGGQDNEGYQVWRTDGTVAGTYKVTRLGHTMQFSGFAEFGPVGESGAIFISDAGGPTSSKLWYTDGTAAGTVRLGVPAAANIYAIERPFALGDLCVFLNFGDGRLWRSDGTTAGSYGLTPANTLGYLVGAVTDGKFYFSDITRGTTAMAYVTDGTVAGTSTIPGVTPTAVGMVRPIGSTQGVGLFNSNAGVFASYGDGAPAVLLSSTRAVLHSRTFMDGPDGTYYFGIDGWIWVTDGKPAGTRRAAQLVSLGGETPVLASPGSPNNDAPYEFDTAMAGSRLVFQATTPSTGKELWGFDPLSATSGDCDGNGVADAIDLNSGAGADANRNGRLDACECLADWNGGGLGTQDVLDFVGDWMAGRADFNHSGGTEVQDIFDFLNAWFVGCP